MMGHYMAACLCVLTLAPPTAGENTALGQSSASRWTEGILAFPYAVTRDAGKPALAVMRQDHEQLRRNRSVIGTPLRIGSRSFERGLGTHSISRLRVTSPTPIERLTAWVGVDVNERTSGGAGSVVFAVAVGGEYVYRSQVLRSGQEPQRVDVVVPPSRSVDLIVEDGGDGPSCDHADWADAAVMLADGSLLALSELPDGVADLGGRYPFSFTVGGRSCDELLPAWTARSESVKGQDGKVTRTTTWTDPVSGLLVTFEAVTYSDDAAIDWLLRFTNTGDADTPLIENVQALDIVFVEPMPGAEAYRLHRTAGGTPTPEQFESEVRAIGGAAQAILGAGGGRSSTRDFPFFKTEMAKSSIIAAVGWSGNWRAALESPDRKQLHITAGLEHTRFKLHPTESVRSPRILLMRSEGDTLEANARFRQLIYKHYAARRSGKATLPILFSNTCFTRGGGWLNECNADNQISLIKAYAPLGLEAVITDAGWFEGGWPSGAGNWDPRKDAYPKGMAPVAGAAERLGMVYGLWFEPERVVAGTSLHRDHPDWCLRASDGPQDTYLANFAMPEVRAHFHAIVKGFMNLPGFRVYRQDFNMDPLPYWKHNDAPDRQGVTEMQYIEGLYAFWDSLATSWPDSIREECASGGHRMDLETVKRFHMHQKTDYWFDNEVDQASIWALSQYLPNSQFVAPISRLDPYTFHSVFATSLCIGWIADAEEFPSKRAAAMLGRYLALRPLMVGAYYPLTGYSRSPRDWMAVQFHRADLNAGMLLVFRRAQSPYRSLEVALRGLEPTATYEFVSETSGKASRGTGTALANQMVIALPQPHMSDILVYRKVAK